MLPDLPYKAIKMAISKRKRYVLVFLVGLLLLTLFVLKYRNDMGYVFLAICFGVPTVPELEEIARVQTYLIKHYHFDIIPDAKTEAGSPPDMSRLGGRVGGTGLLGKTPHTIIIWGITNTVHQNQILDILQKYKRQEEARMIILEFYRQENFVYRKTKHGRGGARRPEELIRREKIR